MTKILIDEATVKLVLEYLEESDNYLGSLDHSKPIAALREALAKDVPETNFGNMAEQPAPAHLTNEKGQPLKFWGGKAEQPAQQEPVAMRMPKVGDEVICIEDESLGMVAYLTAGGSPEIRFDDGSHGTYVLREFAELFRYTTPQPEQRKPLTDAEIDELSRTMVKGNKSVNWLCRAIEAAHGIKENT